MKYLPLISALGLVSGQQLDRSTMTYKWSIESESCGLTNSITRLGRHKLKSNQYLIARRGQSQCLESENGKHNLCLETDGRFVLYQDGQEKWSVGDPSDCPDLTSVLRFAEGELSLYQSCGCDALYGYLDFAGTNPIWTWKILVDTSGHLTLEDDGNWAIFSSEMEVVWSVGLSNRECCELGQDYSCTPSCPSFSECTEEPPEDQDCKPTNTCEPPPEAYCPECVVTCDDLPKDSPEYLDKCCKDDPTREGCGSPVEDCDDWDPESPDYPEECKPTEPPTILVEPTCDDLPKDSPEYLDKCCADDPTREGCGSPVTDCTDLDPNSPEYIKECTVLTEPSCDDYEPNSEEWIKEECCKKINPEKDERWKLHCRSCDDIDEDEDIFMETCCSEIDHSDPRWINKCRTCDDIDVDSDEFFDECCEKLPHDDERWIKRCETCKENPDRPECEKTCEDYEPGSDEWRKLECCNELDHEDKAWIDLCRTCKDIPPDSPDYETEGCCSKLDKDNEDDFKIWNEYCVTCDNMDKEDPRYIEQCVKDCKELDAFDEFFFLKCCNVIDPEQDPRYKERCCVDDDTLPGCEKTCDELEPGSKEWFEKDCCSELDPKSDEYTKTCCENDPTLDGCCDNNPLLPECPCTLSPLPEDWVDKCCTLLIDSDGNPPQECFPVEVDPPKPVGYRRESHQQDPPPLPIPPTPKYYKKSITRRQAPPSEPPPELEWEKICEDDNIGYKQRLWAAGLKFENTQGLKGGKPKDEHVARLYSDDGSTYKWHNLAGESWTLTALDVDARGTPTKFRVGEDCPYFGYDFYEVNVNINEFGTLLSVNGPDDTTYNYVIEWTTELEIPGTKIWELGLNFENSQYVEDGTSTNEHYVTIGNPSGDGERFEWFNRDNERWSLAPIVVEGLINGFQVGSDSRLFDKGFKNTGLVYNEVGSLISLIGPGDEEYHSVITFTPLKTTQ